MHELTHTLIARLKAANHWRDTYNPLRAISMQRVVVLLEEGERGQYANLQWLYRMVEKRYHTLRGLLARRTAALKKLDWNIKTTPEDRLPPGATVEQAERQAVTLRSTYDRIDNLRDAVEALARAEFRGFAHLEKHYADRRRTIVSHLEPIPQWHWCRNGLYGEWLFDETASGSLNTGIPIDPADFIIRTVENPINEIALIAFLRTSLSQKDWDGFIESYGIPPMFLVGPPNVQQADWEEFQNTVEAIISDARGVLPNGTTLVSPNEKIAGESPFRAHLDYQDIVTVLAGTSGKLTMLTAPTGLQSGQSDAHEAAFDDLAQAEAGTISELFQRSIDRPTLDAAHPGEPRLAYFELAAPDQEDIGEIIDHAVKLAQAGTPMESADLAERTGYTLLPNQSPLPGGPGGAQGAGVVALPRYPGAANRAALRNRVDARQVNARLTAVAGDQLARAMAADMAPVRARIAQALTEIEGAPDAPEIRALALEKLKEDLPALLKKVNADPTAAKTLADSMTAGAFNGYLAGAASRKEVAA